MLSHFDKGKMVTMKSDIYWIDENALGEFAARHVYWFEILFQASIWHVQ